MTVPLLLALTDPGWEAELVGALAAGPHQLEVARRCVDLADLLAAASAGAGRVAVVSADLRRLDREAVARLAGMGVAVVGVVAAADEDGERRFRQWGVREVVAARSPTADITAAVLAALADPLGASGGWAEPRSALEAGGGAEEPAMAGDAGPGSFTSDPAAAGRRPVVAVWGPVGAPGRSTVAVNLAGELARLAGSALLVDADIYGSAVAQLLGLLDEAPGIAAACRLANAGRLDLLTLSEVAVAIRGGLRVLTGLPRAQRWPELGPAALGAVLDTGRLLAAATVVDVSFCLEQDEELSFDTAAPRRNGATLAALEAADLVVAVGAADPVSLQRFVRGIGELREAVPAAAVLPVVNRVRRGAVPGRDPRAEITAALQRYAGLVPAAFLPDDPAACDAAVAAGRMLAEVAPGGPLRQAIGELAARIAAEHAGLPVERARPSRRRGRRRLLAQPAR